MWCPLMAEQQEQHQLSINCEAACKMPSAAVASLEYTLLTKTGGREGVCAALQQGVLRQQGKQRLHELSPGALLHIVFCQVQEL